MSHLFRYLTIFLAIFTLNNAWACSGESCIKTNSWQLGVAFGLGIKSNPLVDGDNIPLIILPDLAWYGEKAYFDNGELGYQWLNSTNYSLETFVSLDQERAFFSFYHPANLFYPSKGFATAQPITPSTPETSEDRLEFPLAPEEISIDSIAKRNWALNGGIRWHYFENNTEWKVSLQNDVSNVHKGQIVSLSYSYKWLLNDTQIKLRLGADWKSANLVDYYYGVDERDNINPQTYYQASSSLEPNLALNIIKPISPDWYLLANMSYKKLPSAMTLSPLVEEDSIEHIFVGAAYRF
ncbi:MipA/OmpV family protein [Paraglaciecola sp. L3A3]|uniref:MipA/OmpV family protein n=1 Tax=Paraglaciecola sp. L3A3 TaxID=2686358 RepID=UPI00131E4E5B|nr:MipA/OmpV family protein [Paraglaciecola sp. L3A3]